MTSTSDDSPPIACTLSGEDFTARMAWIGALNREALLDHRRDDLRLELIYAPGAAARVREMVRRERDCCAFLSFDVREGAETVRVAITAPETARVAAETLFAQLLTGTAEDGACACAARGAS